MKRRLVAVTLSLVMTVATVSEAGAATFTSPDGNSVVAVQAETETDTEPVDAQSDPEASSEEDIFSAGDETTDVPSQDQTEDVFSAGSDVTSQPEETPSVTTDTTDSSDAVVVKAEDWVNTENGFKLRKPAKTQTTVSSTASEDASASYTDCGQSAEVVQGETEELSQDTAEMDADGTETPDNTDAVNVSDTEPASTADTTDVTADEFYSAADGIVKVSTEYKGETHTGYYLFDENGILVTGQAEVHQDVTGTAAQGEDKDEPDIIKEEITQSYFTTAEEAVVYAGCEGESVTPYYSRSAGEEHLQYIHSFTVVSTLNIIGCCLSADALLILIAGICLTGKASEASIIIAPVISVASSLLSFFHDLFISLLNLFEFFLSLLFIWIVYIGIGMIFSAQLTVCFLYLIIGCIPGYPKYTVRINHSFSPLILFSVCEPPQSAPTLQSREYFSKYRYIL